MAYTVKITYMGVSAPEFEMSAPIADIFIPCGSYTRTPVFTEGYPVGEEEKTYGKSVYATNVDGWGKLKVAEPFATTSFPFPVSLAQFKLAVVSDDQDEEGNPYVEFDVEDYKEAFYYKEAGVQLADQGFAVEVTKN